MSEGKSLVCSVLLLFLQTQCCWGQSKMIVPSQPIIVAVGSDVTLPCEVDPVKNLKDLVVDWGRPDLKPRYIHIRRDGQDHLMSQNPLYQGRTRLSQCGLQCGDMSLKLSRVRLSDGGAYRCFLPQMDTAGEVTLTVVSVSPVAVSLTKDHSGSPVLRCESRGWYPEPELLWLDSDGTVLTGGRTEVQRGVSDETFSVSSRLSVEQSPGNTFTCRVRLQQSRQSRETQITVTDEFLEVPSCSVAWTLSSLGLCLIFAAAVVFVVRKLILSNNCFSNHGKKSANEDAKLGEREEQKIMIKPEEDNSAAKAPINTQSLEVELTKHKENLEKIQDELSFVDGMINKLSHTNEFLKRLKEKTVDIFNQQNSEIAVGSSKSNAPRRKLWKSREQEQKEIKEKERQQCERAIVEIDKQIKTTEEMILEATQRKEQLEAQCENITKLIETKKHLEKPLDLRGSRCHLM